MKRTLLWGVVNGSMALALYCGFFEGITWARNIVVFVVWVTLPVFVFVSANDDARTKLRARGRSVPKWVSGLYDICFVLGLAAAGWFVTAGAHLLTTLCEAMVYDDDFKPNKQA